MTAVRRVVVLHGGTSDEREVSLRSGAAVVDALDASGLPVDAFDPRFGVQALARALEPPGTVVFNALHGGTGENGAVQGLLEMMGVPYTHSGVRASALAMDKPASRDIFAAHGLEVARGVVVGRDELAAGDPLPRPYVVKPLAGGSSIGVVIVRAGDDPPAPGAGREPVLVEEYVPGRELTAAVRDREPLSLLEIRPHGGFYSYDSKYHSDRTRYVEPDDLPDEVRAAALQAAVRAHALLGCRGVTRADFRLDDTAGGHRLVLLEINTQPGLTRTSLVPKLARQAGASFEELCLWLLEDASCPR